jgi:hypothetical protein
MSHQTALAGAIGCRASPKISAVDRVWPIHASPAAVRPGSAESVLNTNTSGRFGWAASLAVGRGAPDFPSRRELSATLRAGVAVR